MAEVGAADSTKSHSSDSTSTAPGSGSEENASNHNHNNDDNDNNTNNTNNVSNNNNDEKYDSAAVNANGNVTTTGQTRFRFYEPQQLVTEENDKKEAQKNHRFSFYDDTTRQELAAVENIRKKEQLQQQQQLLQLMDDSTDDILRSLHETEVQRLQILHTDHNSTSIKTASASSATPRILVVGGGENASNPYEDAIREALDLLRKHRSPPGTPAETVHAAAITAANPTQLVSVKQPPTGTLTDKLLSSITAADVIERSRTPRDKDRLLQHRMDQVDSVDHDRLRVITIHPETLPEDNYLPRAGLPTSPFEGELTDAYEEHKLKAKQRQERMAQYASRLQEFKSSLPAETVEQHWPPNMTPMSSGYYQTNIMDAMDDIIPHTQSHDSNGFSELSHLSQSTKEQVEAEVQRGVERVLLAILERASVSRGRASIHEGASGSPGHVLFDQNTTATTASVGSEVGDALIRALDEISLKNTNSNSSTTASSTNRSCHLKSKTSGETQGSGMGSKRSATSVVDELLAEDEDDDIVDVDDDNIKDGTGKYLSISKDMSTQGRIGQTWGHPKEEKKLPDSQEKDRLHLSSYGTIEEDHNPDDDVDRLMEECLRSSQSEESKNTHDLGHRKRVLGPLSKRAGGTTGVVLDIDVDVANDVKTYHLEKDPSSTSGVCKGPFSDDEDSSNGNIKSTEDKYSTEEDTHNHDDDTVTIQEDSPVDDEDDNDFEATELMRTLCAHFLPFGVDHKFKLAIEAIPDWDESNTNEAGYRIIRLTRTQLQRVELAFENMVNGLKQISQKELGEESGDAKFVSELQEVERLLDESEGNRLKLADSTKAQNGILDKSLSACTSAKSASAISADDKQDTSSDEECHPHFPGVKSTGKGEMGDLEYFHLPIIFKSHVTGFEPTKDLVLEPGNVVAGQYLVESELGSAAFSTAYRCIDLSTESEDGHEEVCLKVIKNTKDFFDQSLDEIKILELLRQTGKVQDNHIVEMKCFFYYREHLVIVTELLRQNLFEFGKFILDNNEEPYFTVTRLAYLTRQALTSLRFVHSLGLVHSDVKPENMLLSSYSRAQIKLIDFGSSCYLTDRQSSYIQSRSYRAPEVVLGLPYDGRIDVWSLGCVVAEMFTGEVTFQNDSIVSMLSRIEAICGPFPRHMIAQGRQSGRFFTKSGLLYEVVEDSESGECNKNAPGPHDDEDDRDYNAKMQFDIFQPKNTRLCTRLGFDPDIMDDFDLETHTPKRVSLDRWHQQLFTDFIRRLLTIDPDGRPTADEALNHPWMQYAATLTEEEVKYPS